MTGGQLPNSVPARGVRLLRACGDAGTALTLAEPALRTGLPNPTAHRLDRRAGPARPGRAPEQGSYRIGLGLFVPGQPAPTVRELWDAPLPHLGDLHEVTLENVHPAGPDGPGTLFPEKATGRRATPIVSRTGGRLPAHRTATGKVFLAQDPRPPHRTLLRLTPRTMVLPGQLARDLALTRARGYGVNLEEAEERVRRIGLPVTPVTPAAVPRATGAPLP